MTKFGKKLVASIMTLTFAVSLLPVHAITSQPTAQPASEVKSVRIVGDANIKNGNKRLSVSLRDSNVKQALRMFADKAGLNIIFHDSVEDKNVTLDLVGVTLNDALRMVMQATDLSYFVDGDTIIIMAADKAKSLNISKQNMLILPVKYTDAAEVASFLNKNVFSTNRPGLSNTEIVGVNPAKNELLIFGTKSDYDMAVKMLEVLDTPTRITNFKVNHVTPAEMANNICTALLKSFSGDDTSANDNNDDDDDDDDSSSSSSGGNEASGLSEGDAGGQKVKLGKAKLACTTGNAQGKSGGPSLQQGSGPYSMNINAMKVMYFNTLGTISIIGGSQDQLDTIAAYISATDVKQPMAYLEISFIDLKEAGRKDFQTNWNLLTQNFSVVTQGAATIIGAGAVPGQGSPINFRFPKDASGDYTGTATINAYFRYLIESEKAKLLANPKILVTSGKKSKIDIGEDYLKTLKATTNTVTSGTTTNFEPEIGNDQGVIMTITPYISRDGYVVMNLSPAYTKKVGQYTSPTTGETLASFLSRRTLELNNVRVKDGDTLILGGMIEDNDAVTESKVPILGDIPGIGFFFRNTHTDREKRELVILITPHIIDEGADVATTVQNQSL